MQHIRAVPAVQGPAAVVWNTPNLPPPLRHHRPLLLLRRPVLLPRRRCRPPRKVGGTKDSRDCTDDRAPRAADAVAAVVGAKDRRRQAQMTDRWVVPTSHRRMRGNGQTSSNSDARMKVLIAAAAATAAAAAAAAVTPAQLLPRLAPKNSPLQLSHGYRHIAERNHRPNAIHRLRKD